MKWNRQSKNSEHKGKPKTFLIDAHGATIEHDNTFSNVYSNLNYNKNRVQFLTSHPEEIVAMSTHNKGKLFENLLKSYKTQIDKLFTGETTLDDEYTKTFPSSFRQSFYEKLTSEGCSEAEKHECGKDIPSEYDQLCKQMHSGTLTNEFRVREIYNNMSFTFEGAGSYDKLGGYGIYELPSYGYEHAYDNEKLDHNILATDKSCHITLQEIIDKLILKFPDHPIRIIIIACRGCEMPFGTDVRVAGRNEIFKVSGLKGLMADGIRYGVPVTSTEWPYKREVVDASFIRSDKSKIPDITETFSDSLKLKRKQSRNISKILIERMEKKHRREKYIRERKMNAKISNKPYPANTRSYSQKRIPGSKEGYRTGNVTTIPKKTPIKTPIPIKLKLSKKNVFTNKPFSKVKSPFKTGVKNPRFDRGKYKGFEEGAMILRGTGVTLKDLQKRKDLNSKKGVVTGYDKSANRYIVQILSGKSTNDTVRVKKKNII